ncbi:MAG: phosphoadenosine phosphosulfate reductase family protein [Thermoplasmatota archaeon]
MSIVRLGKLHLHWCDDCNLPLVEKGGCSRCGSEGRKVNITPPGDVRPAFGSDISLIRDTIDRQWGDGYSEKLFSDDKIILLNKSPALDRMDEVIIDGRVIGNLRYNLRKKAKGKSPYEFILRPWKSMPEPKKGFVVIDQGAVKPISKGGSVLVPGIIDIDEEIENRDEVMILAPNKEVIASGRAQMSAEDMLERDRGKGVKNRWRSSDEEKKHDGQTWDEVLEANDEILNKRIEEAVSFIKEAVQTADLEPAVSYSGGKDSLATLLLVLDAGIEPDLIFIDTGIELPETIENVEKISNKYGLELKTKKVKGGYWDNVDYFGPSARDYRWCCKTCKLGPTARLIDENYPDGVLSFIGQRRYESQQRMDKGNIWQNPWVPNQKGASPIQEWTALHVWMYIFKKDADYNPLYEKGFERIGCWVCPASDLSELEYIKENLDIYSKFEKVLEEYRKKNDLSELWVELGLWRWIEVPVDIKKILSDIDEDDKERYEHLSEDEVRSSLKERSIDDMLDDERTSNLLQIYEDRSYDWTQKDRSRITGMYKRSQYCVECGICVSKCKKDALSFDSGIKLDPELCTGCLECLEKCPVVTYEERI